MKEPDTEIPALDLLDNNIIIKQWQILGPIAAKPPDSEGDDHDSLLDYILIAEQDATSENLRARPKARAPLTKATAATLRNFHYDMKDDYIDLREVLGGGGPAFCYLASTLYSPIDQDAVLLIKAAPTAGRIWVNHELVFNESDSLRKYCAVHLRKGDNSILAKSILQKGHNSWLFPLGYVFKPQN